MSQSNGRVKMLPRDFMSGSQEKWKTSKLLSNLKTQSCLPWHMGGDLNKIFYHSEKKGGPPKSQTLVNNFRDSFMENGLYDLGYSGYQLTWCNYQQNGTVVEERLDHFCADTDWPLIFPNVQVNHVDSDISNHLPILLKCSPNTRDRSSRGKHFHFENMWHIDPSCNCYLTLVVLLCWYGDANTQWFHYWVTMRKAKNKIVGLYDASGIWRTTHDEITSIVTSYFGELFTYSSPTHVEDVLDCGCLDLPLSNPSPHIVPLTLISRLVTLLILLMGVVMINGIFLLCDAELIIKTPLCESWPSNKLIWHYSTNGIFTVCLAYYMLIDDKLNKAASPFLRNIKHWRAIWSSNIPPYIWSHRRISNPCHLRGPPSYQCMDRQWGRPGPQVSATWPTASLKLVTS
ncbi:LOW QUALITY PROTEIN: hypothetical protein Cgig2_014393 [Carnegiea gigantea]|uniref:Uncharacterized protein n=1 Tax=Carnegiea gigantea TaxID=171969 RepID=A0A9Q1QA46_9CARY|nr:LOW QUALITY PROTEIN: hypothetical protein Cgig2_014393 [Carnegiea gigantea]